MDREEILEKAQAGKIGMDEREQQVLGLSFGIGGIPDAAAMSLMDKHDLGLHTEQFTSSMADLIDAGADNGRINRIMFETKSKTYARLERLAIESMRFYEHERVAVITVTQEMFQLTGSNAQETEGLAPLTRQIEGVEIGITIQERPDGTCKASIRTFESVNAAKLAACFGGGGHAQAAGCKFDCDVKEARRLLVDKCREMLE